MENDAVEEDAPSLAVLRAVAASQGVSVEDADLEAVLPFLNVLLPAFEELEQLLPQETPA